MRIKVEDTIALVVDYQEKIMPAMHQKEILLENSIKLLTGLNILQVPMIVTGQYTKGLGLNVPEIFEAVGSDAYTDKVTFSAFEVASVSNQIKGKYKNVIICGIEAHVCILQTLLDVKDAGLQPILVADCISSRKEQDKHIALKRAEMEGAIITTYESLLFELTQKAGTDSFKQISKLIR